MRLFLLIIFLCGSIVAKAQEIEVFYSFSGLGSNMGHAYPVFRISNGKFVYTREVNSYWHENQIKPADTILVGMVVPRCIQGLEEIMAELGDTTIQDWNMSIMSGGHHSIHLIKGSDTVDIGLHNSWHLEARRIVDLLNLNIPNTSEHLSLSDEKWGMEYVQLRVKQLQDTLMTQPSLSLKKHIREYEFYRLRFNRTNDYYLFAYDFVFYHHLKFFKTMTAEDEVLLKKWASLVALEVRNKADVAKDSKGLVRMLSDEFTRNISDYPLDRKMLANLFWEQVIEEAGINLVCHSKCAFQSQVQCVHK